MQKKQWKKHANFLCVTRRPRLEQSSGQSIRPCRKRGYNPINQLVGYLLSGDPAYITNHKNARNQIRQLERDEILEELVRTYLVSK